MHRGTAHFECTTDEIHRAYVDASLGRPAARPVVEMTMPSALDPTLAPAGRHVVQVRGGGGMGGGGGRCRLAACMRVCPGRNGARACDRAGAPLSLSVLARPCTDGPRGHEDGP